MQNPEIKTSHDSPIVYRINDQDEITYTNQEWSRFAVANNSRVIAFEHTIGRSLWDFIKGETTRLLYQSILLQVRRGQSARFHIRCDSAKQRRLIEMAITRREDGEVEFETRALKVESRRPPKLLDSNVSRSGEILKMCAWCNRVSVSEEVWEEVEQAIGSLELFDREPLPSISHGICKQCYQRISASIVNRN